MENEQKIEIKKQKPSKEDRAKAEFAQESSVNTASQKELDASKEKEQCAETPAGKPPMDELIAQSATPFEGLPCVRRCPEIKEDFGTDPWRKFYSNKEKNESIEFIEIEGIGIILKTVLGQNSSITFLSGARAVATPNGLKFAPS